MSIRILSSCLALAMLAACAQPPTQSKASRPDAKAPSAPAANPAQQPDPVAAPQNTAPVTNAPANEPVDEPPAVAPAAKPANPFGLPREVGVAMPTAFSGVISAGTGNLIGQAGGQVISAGGGNAIATGNYTVQAGGEPTPAERLRQNMGMYLAAQTITQAIVAKVAAQNPVPGEPFTFEDPNKPGQQLTGLLEVLEDHALISIGREGQAKGEDQLISFAYTSEKAGKLIYRSPAEAAGRLAASITFDNDKGTTTAEATFDNMKGIAVAATWSFEQPAEAAADGVSFKLRSASNVSTTTVKLLDFTTALSANFLPSGEAAFIGGIQTPILNQGKFLFLPRPGVSLFTPEPRPHDHYMGGDGKDLATDAATAALKAVLPADDHLLDPLPKATANSLASFVFEK